MASVQSLNTIQEMYLSYYQRPGDPSGLLYWADQLEAPGGSLQLVEAAFGNSAESLALYGPINSTTIGDVVDKIYLGLFNRLPDAAGKAFYVNGFNNGTFSPAGIAFSIAVGAQNTDAVTIQNKLIAADRFSEIVDGKPLSDPTFGQGTTDEATYAGPTDAAAARGWLHPVDSNPTTIPSVSQTIVFIQQNIANPGDPILNTVPGQSYVLTPNVDLIIGTAGNDLVSGVFGAGAPTDTLTVGDSITGGAGIDTLSLTAAGLGASPAAVTVKGVEIIAIKDALGATFDGTGVADNPEINFSGTVAGNTSKVIMGALGSMYGLSGPGNLTVGYANTSGAADTAKLSVNGAGTSSKASVIDVSNGGTIEAISLNTTGANFANILGGSAKTLTVTGAGTNDLTIGSMAIISTIDATNSTGTNTFRLGSSLNTGDTVKGGTGADTVAANFTAASIVNPTLTGVETLQLDFDAAATLNLSKTTGATTVLLQGGTDDATITNADAGVTTVKVLGQGAAQDLNFYHATGVTAPLTLQIGGGTGANNTNITLDQTTLKGVSALTINEVGSKTHSLDGVSVDHDLTALNINIAGGDTSLGGFNANGHDVDALNVTLAANAIFSGYIQMSGGDLGDVQLTANAGASGELWITTSSGGGSIGDINMDILGTDASFYLLTYVSAGDIGNLTVKVDGANTSGHFSTLLSGGDMGNIDIDVKGTNSMFHVQISANAYDYDKSLATPDRGGGNIGNVTIKADGTDAFVSGSFDTDGGDIGNVSITMHGTFVSGSLAFSAGILSGDINGTGADDYVRGGNIGDITVDINGVGAEVDLTFHASGGSIGNVVYSLVGIGASGWLDLNAIQTTQSGDPGGNIGNIDITLGDNVNFSGIVHADVSTGAITLVGGDQVSGQLYFSGGTTGAVLQIGDVDVTLGDNGGFTIWYNDVSGSTGNTTVTLGDFAYLNVEYGWVRGNAGATTITAGDQADVIVQTTATMQTMDLVTLIGGNGGSGMVDIDDPTAVFGGVDASLWEGDLDVYLMGLASGTLVTTGAGGSYVSGGAFADQIFGGAGVDDVYGDDGDDVIAGGGGNDILRGGNGKDTITGDAGNDTITGGTGADNMAGGAGNDTFKEAAADSVPRTAENITAAAVVAGETITFGNGVDVINGFVSGADKLDVGTAANYTQFTVGSNVQALTAGNNYGLRGNFNVTSNVFTVSATGSDMLVVTNAVAADLDAATQDAIVILVGTTSLATGDFT
jgi:hypothetical protein